MELRDRFEIAFEATPEARTPHRPLDERLAPAVRPYGDAAPPVWRVVSP